MSNPISSINLPNIVSNAKHENSKNFVSSGKEFSETLENVLNKEESLKKASLEFESYFLNTMFKSMRKTINYSDGIFKRSSAENLFQEMIDEQMSEDIAKAGGIGLADLIYKSLSKKEDI